MSRLYVTLVVVVGMGLVAPMRSYGYVYNRGKYAVADTADYKITYQVKIVRDTAFRDDVKSAYLVTLIGDKSAKSLDLYELEYKTLLDSMHNAGIKDEDIAERAFQIKKKGTFYDHILMDYPQRGTVLFQTYIAGNRYRVYDKDCKQQWVLTDETRDILGYQCRKATCDFRGRRYEAWYTEDVPIPGGPYYFRGLPGLIVELYDTDRDYVFSMIGLESVTEVIPIDIYDNNYEVTSRDDLRYIDEYYSKDRAAGLFASPFGSQIEMTPELLKRINTPRPYNPIERE